jgi:periplasmic protein TonB
MPAPDTGHSSDPGGPDGPDIPGVPGGPVIPGLPSTDANHPPPPPVAHSHAIERRHLSEPVQAAMLIHRVQPIYPALAMQIRREGRVELHAIIATDGTIQSLEVVNGDPLFIQSALAAVRAWRYRPTILDGQPVEVDTQITVIYTLSH